jgi:hypothetical protein
LPEKNHKETKGDICPPFIIVIVDFNEAKKLKKTPKGMQSMKEK